MVFIKTISLPSLAYTHDQNSMQPSIQVAEIQYYVRQICCDEMSGLSNSVKAIKASLNDLLPEVLYIWNI